MEGWERTEFCFLKVRTRVTCRKIDSAQFCLASQNNVFPCECSSGDNKLSKKLLKALEGPVHIHFKTSI